MEKFIIYKRVSTDSQAKSGHGLNAQQRDIEIYFANFADTPYTVLKEFTEIASGASSDRPLFDQAVQLARKTGATLIASKLDRFSRKVSVIASLMDDSKLNLRVAAMPTADKFQLHIYAALAEQERDFISIRTKAALKEVKNKGVKLGGARPGQDKLHKAKKDKADANALKIAPIINSSRKDGKSYQFIADTLNALKVKTATGGLWYMATVRRYDLRLQNLSN